jgi:hypothetical protein
VLVHPIVDSIMVIVGPDPVVRGRAAVVDPALLTHNDGTPSPIQAPQATSALVSTQ